MAKNEQRSTFPVIPTKHWWALREKFKQSIPGVVTDNYLATVLHMGVPSARNNILPSLKQMGLIDENGEPKERARRWRDDKQYSKICDEIKKEIYPQDLLDAVSNPSEERGEAKSWFATQTGAGSNAVSKMVACYTLLCEADLSKVKETKGRSTMAVQKKQKPKPPMPEDGENQHTRRAPEMPSDNSHHPQVCVNLQIHISADASTEQIDQIFASMAKHIYQRKL